jgi:polysaccharide export outer membrane protein
MTSIAVLLALALQAPSPAAAQTGYQVGPDDVLMITVTGEADLTGERIVGLDGTIDVPWIGRVNVAGLTTRAVEDALVKRLVDGGFFVRVPQLSVHVKAYRSQSVYVMGEVAQPGDYPLTGNMTIMDVINKARLLPSAGEHIHINRPPSGRKGAVATADPGDGTTVTKIRKSDLQSGLAAQNVALQDGDTIFVPKAESIYITGYVQNPGPYTYDGELTVLQALALAGGVTERGARNRIKIIRQQPDGKPKELKNVKMTEIVKPGDTIEVPQRRM